MTGLSERLARKIEVDPSGCWLWTAATSHGYGVAWVAGRTMKAHRAVYEELVENVPQGTDLDHLCRVRNCVNPDHLEPVTRQTNLLRGQTLAARNAAKTECPQGHPYDPNNTVGRSRPGRECLACARERMRRIRANQKEK